MEECLFCKIAMEEVHSQKIYEDDDFVAFLDINPRNPGHVLVIPKKHYNTIFEMSENDAGQLFRLVKKVSVAVKKGMNADGISIAQSNERAAGQVIPHVHFHVIPRFLSESPPGLETILPTKKLTKEVFDETAERIGSFIGEPEEYHESHKAEKAHPKKQKDEFNF